MPRPDRACRAGAPWLAALLLVATAGLARAEDMAALLARAPPLPLDGPVAPLVAPVAVTRAGWGPFRRLCVVKGVLAGTAQATAWGLPNCFDIEEARQDGETWHLAIRTDPPRGRMRVAFRIARDAAGRVGGATVELPDGMPPPAPDVIARVEGILRDALRANGLERATIGPGASFLMPIPADWAGVPIGLEGGGFTCRAEGEAPVGGRSVLVAACEGRASGAFRPGQRLSHVTAGRFAIDVETGMVLRHAYAYATTVDAPPGSNEGLIEVRGASRLSLE